VRLTIFKKVLLLAALPLAFQLAFLMLLHQVEQVHARAGQNIAWSRDAIEQGGRLLHSAVVSELGASGYAITADPAFILPFQRSANESREVLDRLSKLVEGGHAQAGRAREIIASSQRLDQWSDEVRRLTRAGQVDAARRMVREGGGKIATDELRRHIDELVQIETAKLAANQATFARTGRQMNCILWGGGLTSLGGTLLLGIVLARSIRGGMETLVQNARALLSLEPMIPRKSDRNEFSEVDQTLRQMGQALRDADRKQREYTASLEREVAGRTNQLQQTNLALESQMQENELFGYSVSHDLRSPLVNLQGFSRELDLLSHDVMTMIADPRVPAEIQARVRETIEADMTKSIHFIQGAVTRLSGIIDALLRLSRAGRVEYQARSVDVQTIVTRVVETLDGTALQRGADISVGTLTPAYGDAQAIEQIFANLIGNALNYLDAARPGRIEIGCRESRVGDRPAITYYVGDNGKGISAQNKAKLFHSFKRFNPELAPGEGMGLLLVRRIVERHGGKIWIESEAEVGTTLFVQLPGAPTSASEPDTSPLIPNERNCVHGSSTAFDLVGGRR